MILSESKLQDLKIGESYSSEIGTAEIFMRQKKRENQYDLLHRYRNHHDEAWNAVNGKFPRCSFFTYEGNLKFMGTFVPMELRRKGLFDDYLVLLDEVAKKVGGVFDETVIIRKPLIARRLLDNGFEPQKNGAQTVEILPLKKGNEGLVRIGASPAVAKHLTRRRFYEVVSGESLLEYPITNPDRSLVQINTRYTRNEAFKITSKVEFDLGTLGF